MKRNNLSIDILGKNIETILTPAQCLQDIIAAYTEYKKIQEQEITKRQKIKAWEAIELARINILRKVVIEYLDNSFDERKDSFQKMFDLLDVAISENNNEQLALTLSSIADLAKNNPLEQLSNLDYVSKALNDPSHVWEF